METIYSSPDCSREEFVFKKKMKAKARKRRLVRRDHYWDSKVFKAPLCGLTDANKIIPGNAVSPL